MTIKILFITDVINTGGSYTYLRSFVHEVSKQTTASIDLITFGNSPLPLKTQNIPKFNYHHISISREYSLISIPKKIIKLFRHLSTHSSSYDLLITDLINPGLCTIITKQFFPSLRRIPHLHQFHGSPSLEKQSAGIFSSTILGHFKYLLHFYLEKFVLHQVSSIIVFSRYSQHLIDKLHHLQKKVIIARAGVDHFLTSKYRNISKSQAKSLLGFDPQTPIFLLVSRIEKRKGIDQFIAKFPQYHGKGQLILCSNFDQVYFNLFPILNQSKLGSRIKLINSPSPHQLSLLYRAATATILPSTMLETFGFVTLESLYFNTPVLAFDIGANPELIEAKYLIKYGSKNHWQMLVSRLNGLEDHPIEKYHSSLIHSFSWSSYLQKILALAKSSDND